MNCENPINNDNVNVIGSHTPLNEKHTVLPYRLTFVPAANYCDFCLVPTGISYSHYTDIDELCGFISCKSCIEVGHEAVINWKSNRICGRVEHLRNRLVKIYRNDVVKQKKSDTIGVASDTPKFLRIQGGWMIDSYPCIDIVNNIEYVRCKMLLNDTIKNCRVDDLLLLNGSK